LGEAYDQVSGNYTHAYRRNIIHRLSDKVSLMLPKGMTP
jgi:hypothetical protein